MPKIILDVRGCMDCPHKVVTNCYSSDGWDRMEDWACSKLDNKKIQGGIEWHEEKRIFPDWCPIKYSENENNSH